MHTSKMLLGEESTATQEPRGGNEHCRVPDSAESTDSQKGQVWNEMPGCVLTTMCTRWVLHSAEIQRKVRTAYTLATRR
jgi:hypothetical protein